VQYIVSILFASICYFLIIRLVFFNIMYKFVVLLSMCFLCCVFFVFVLFCVLFLLLYTAVSFLFVLQVYRPLTPGGNPIAVNKYVLSNILPDTVYICGYQVMKVVPTFMSRDMITCGALI
jgi:hypothetical protein